MKIHELIKIVLPNISVYNKYVQLVMLVVHRPQKDNLFDINVCLTTYQHELPPHLDYRIDYQLCIATEKKKKGQK